MNADTFDKITDAMRLCRILGDDELPSQGMVNLANSLLKLYEANTVPWLAKQLAPMYQIPDRQLPPCVLNNEGAGFYGESVKLPLEDDGK